MSPSVLQPTLVQIEAINKLVFQAHDIIGALQHTDRCGRSYQLHARLDHRHEAGPPCPVGHGALLDMFNVREDNNLSEGPHVNTPLQEE